MVERTDIDALLISALYGELTPAQESQLNAHLESHPADRSALDGLTRTRAALHESRILKVQYEPSQSVSAMLMQEAARRAPKAAAEGEGWFARFARSFMQHPAMAAAAMLVLVVGIAAVVSRNGGGFAEKTVDSSSQSESAAVVSDRSAAAPTATANADQSGAAPGAGSAAPADEAPDSFQVNLEEGGKQQLAQAQAEASRDARKLEVAQAPRKKADTGVALNREPVMPKELETKSGKAMYDRVESNEAPAADPSAARGDAGYRDGTVGRQGAPVAPAPPPPPPAVTKPSPTAAPKGALLAADDAKEEAPLDKKSVAKDAPTDPNVAWAKDQHDRLKALVKANNCAAAADVALAIADRAPAYYAQSVATDRAVKECNQYIAQKIDQRNEARAQRERAKKANAEPGAPKRAVDEAKPASTSK